MSYSQPVLEELSWLVQNARVPTLRSMRQFAEEEIVIPDGPHEGKRFRVDRQPYTRLLFDAIDSGRWSRFCVTGPSQSGKTLSSFVIPILYHLFEVQETVICGLPSMEMAADKWAIDLEPVIRRSRYAELLPRKGSGSRGAKKLESVKFLNGRVLKFMSGGASGLLGDKARAGFTSRVLVITETDGMDDAGGGSREADKIAQLEARTRAYRNKRVYMECTVSTAAGRTWREYTAGTASRIAMPCPHCQKLVTPEREHLVGWREADDPIAARVATFACPACGLPWSETQRAEANRLAVLLHRGQTVNEAGAVEGHPSPTDTLGFRWSAVNNLFVTAADLASDEWKASRDQDEENAEKAQRQFVWAMPYDPPRMAETPLELAAIAGRTRGLGRGVVPADVEHLAVGIDLGKYRMHWAAVAWRASGTFHLVDFGVQAVATNQLGLELAVMTALREFRDSQLALGWPLEKTGECIVPGETWVDSGYQTGEVYGFCRESGKHSFPVKGQSATQYQRPSTKTKHTRFIGDGYHVGRMQEQRILLVEINSDHWKGLVHERLSSPMESSGALSICVADLKERMDLAKQLTAERQVSEFVAGKGQVTKWEKIRGENHWLDCVAYALGALHHLGARTVLKVEPVKPSAAQGEHQAEKKASWLTARKRTARAADATEPES